MRNVLLHIHPLKISPYALRFTRTFGLGGMAALLVVLQILTGVMLRFYYQSSPAEAYDSIVYLKDQVLFGPLVRNLHHWSGVFLLLVVFLHLLRVFFTGAYRGARRINWLFGLLLLLLVVFSNFTGYLLPWDQLAYWAVTVGTTLIGYLPVAGKGVRGMILGGQEVSGVTLQNFYTFHTAILPFLLLALILYHFWRVRKAGGVMIPQSGGPEEPVPVMPGLVLRELVAALALLALLFACSALFNAPLRERANPAFSMNPTKAPWYFAGIQELLMHFHPLFAAFVIPAGALVFLAWLPFFRYPEAPKGEWFVSEKGRKSAVRTAVFAAIVTLAGILFNEYVVNFEILLPGLPAWVSNGILPLLVLGILAGGYYLFYLRPAGLSGEELVQAAFVFLVTAFLVLTVIGIFFRGKDMALTLPWNIG
jgi:quinol-cytochrome oxidoreductase complex cytochrome b subunit